MERSLLNHIGCKMTVSINGDKFYGELGYENIENNFFLKLDINESDYSPGSDFIIEPERKKIKGNMIFFTSRKIDFYKVENLDFLEFKRKQSEEIKEVEIKVEEEKNLKSEIANSFDPFEK